MSEGEVIAELARRLDQLEHRPPNTFLWPDELATLTGRKTKSRQIAALKKMGVAFMVNDIGHPVVARSVIEGKKPTPEERPKWVPKVLSGE